MGYEVGIYKPIETGINLHSKTSDAYLLLQEAKKYNKNLIDFTITDTLSYYFPYPSAPYIAKQQQR